MEKIKQLMNEREIAAQEIYDRIQKIINYDGNETKKELQELKNNYLGSVLILIFGTLIFGSVSSHFLAEVNNLLVGLGTSSVLSAGYALKNTMDINKFKKEKASESKKNIRLADIDKMWQDYADLVKDVYKAKQFIGENQETLPYEALLGDYTGKEIYTTPEGKLDIVKISEVKLEEAEKALFTIEKPVQEQPKTAKQELKVDPQEKFQKLIKILDTTEEDPAFLKPKAIKKAEEEALAKKQNEKAHQEQLKESFLAITAEENNDPAYKKRLANKLYLFKKMVIDSESSKSNYKEDEYLDLINAQEHITAQERVRK